MKNAKKKMKLNIRNLLFILLILAFTLTSATAEETQVSMDQGVKALNASLELHFSERGKALKPETSAPEEYRNCMVIWEHDGLPVSMSVIEDKAEQVFYMSGSADVRNAAIGYTIWSGTHTGTGTDKIYIGETSNEGIPTNASDDVVYGFMPSVFPTEDEEQTTLSEYKSLVIASSEKVQGWLDVYSQAIGFMPETDDIWKTAYENPYEALISYRYSATTALSTMQGYEYADDYEDIPYPGLFLIHEEDDDLLFVKGENNVLVMGFDLVWTDMNRAIGWIMAELNMYGIPADSLPLYEIDMTADEPELIEYEKGDKWLLENTLTVFLNDRNSMLDSD